MSFGELATTVVIERAILSGAESDGMLQLVATVYVDEREFAVLAPPKAIGDAIKWLDNCSVHISSVTTPGADVVADPAHFLYVIQKVREELEKRQEKSRSTQPDLNSSDAYYHVILTVANEPDREVKFDLPLAKLKELIVAPHSSGNPIWLNGRAIPLSALSRIQLFSTPYPSSAFQQEWTKLFAKNGRLDWHEAERGVTDVTDEFIRSPQPSQKLSHTQTLELVCHRFQKVALQLQERYGNRPTLVLEDEYDVQYLFHALLRIFFEDVRPEEWTPSYAGKSSRMDFLLPIEETVLEVKKTRESLRDAEIGSQLLVDIARYKAHQQCKRLICFVYDPENRIRNPRGLERDLSKKSEGLDVKVIISSQR
jgi:DpnII restriction endonuclease